MAHDLFVVCGLVAGAGTVLLLVDVFLGVVDGFMLSRGKRERHEKALTDRSYCDTRGAARREGCVLADTKRTRFE